MRISPWNLGRAMACPGSPGIENHYPGTRRKEAGEGKLAHMASAAILDGREPGSLTDLDEDMLFYVMSYVRHCRALALFGDSHVEEKFHGEHFNGIIDFWSFNSNDETLYIRDLKYGFGWVEVYLNWQLLAYAMLVLSEPAPAVKHINLGICQPRANHPQGPNRTWTITVAELETYRAQMNKTIQAIYAGEVQTVSGPHCGHCRGLIRCHSAAAAAAHAIDVALTPGHEEPTPGQIAGDLAILDRAVKLLGNKKAALEQSAVEQIRKGTIIPGWEVGQNMGSAIWKHGPERVIDLGKMMACDLSKPPSPITPTQARNRKLISKDAFEAMSERKPGAWALRKVNQSKIKELLK